MNNQEQSPKRIVDRLHLKDILKALGLGTLIGSLGLFWALQQNDYQPNTPPGVPTPSVASPGENASKLRPEYPANQAEPQMAPIPTPTINGGN